MPLWLVYLHLSIRPQLFKSNWDPPFIYCPAVCTSAQYLANSNLAASQVALVVKNPLANVETQEMRVRSLGQEDPLEGDMATYSNIFAWRTAWTEEPGGLQSIGLQESDMTEATSCKHSNLIKNEHVWCCHGVK